MPRAVATRQCRENLGDRYTEPDGQASNDIQARSTQTALDLADVRPVKAGTLRERFLREVSGFPQFPNTLTEGPAKVPHRYGWW